jgi:hypothetical protein
MTLQDLEQQVMELPIDARWQLVQSVLASIQQETHWSNSGGPVINETSTSTLPETASHQAIHPWAQSLVGVIKPSEGDDTETYIDYLEQKYEQY